MTDHGDNLSRRYRELAREEPSAALDDAILAASRRAVSPRSRMRWAAPVSVAAVLVLGIGVALRMQVEQPGVETSMPSVSPPSEYSVPQVAEAPPAREEQARPAPKPEPATPAPPALRAKRLDAPSALADAPAAAAAQAPSPQFVPAPAPAPPAAAEVRTPAAPSASVTVPMQAAEPPPPRGSVTLSGAANTAERAAAAPLAKREAFATDSMQRRELADKPKDERETELERIAKLRGEARHAEADKALEEFRRRHPDYRIAPAMWERVRPRP